MQRKRTRFAAATVLTVALAGGSAAMTAASAVAAPAPIIVGSCGATISGAPGTPIELDPKAVLTPIIGSVAGSLPMIPLGSIPAGGTSTITGAQVVTAVDGALNSVPLLGPLVGGLIGQVQQALTKGCDITVQAVNAVVAPAQSAVASVATAAQQVGSQAAQSLGLAPKSGAAGGTPGKTGGGTGGSTGPSSQSATGSLQGAPSPASSDIPVAGSALWQSMFGPQLLSYGPGESPWARYTGIPFATAGLFAPYSGLLTSGVPGYAPASSLLGSQDSSVPPDLYTAGHAEALRGGGFTNGVGLPMLLAVLALAGVTAGLVRTWALRRTVA
jgi:hypothetical protein